MVRHLASPVHAWRDSDQIITEACLIHHSCDAPTILRRKVNNLTEATGQLLYTSFHVLTQKTKSAQPLITSESDSCWFTNTYVVPQEDRLDVSEELGLSKRHDKCFRVGTVLGPENPVSRVLNPVAWRRLAPSVDDLVKGGRREPVMESVFVHSCHGEAERTVCEGNTEVRFRRGKLNSTRSRQWLDQHRNVSNPNAGGDSRLIAEEGRKRGVE
jgi:hypothetical protein